ncbi:glycerophosphodiester phosphodiesterase [Christiangramia fulva]|uniref:Glycerophosphodiester phosphodiesterase n=1 Tax=Christiangramia fulva TaxID=2126553 RepID=A0A2R3Z230_9FLAO|nr:glycerophosphodiester phosphodiesterase family protein [Christiangramia fulva]AVR44330.1 glycerophosphodiester phosphodiesterase [Christiangramia fulva]
MKNISKKHLKEICKTWMWLIIVSLSLFSCKNKSKEEKVSFQETSKIEIQGHRGERGHFPENSLPAFINAIKDSADVLEMDVVITKDQKVVVSHEPYLASTYVLQPNGDSISLKEERNFNIHEMSYDSVKKFDAGSKGNSNFPDQHKMKTYKPLLSEVIDSVESFVRHNDLEALDYNIEIKSVPEEYGVYQPKTVSEFVDLVMKVMKDHPIKGDFNIQSFDPAVLQDVHDRYPNVKLSYLVYKPGIEKNLQALDFVPEIYSPSYTLIESEEFIDSIKRYDMELIPWTVNDTADINKMIRLKVDGIISDYPDRVFGLLKQKKLPE